MKNHEIEKVKSKCVEILDEIDRICTKEKIQYYMYGGTLLGAVRHKGFIPWDDDIDIVMFREDYNRFINICETKLNKDKYILQTIWSDKYTSNPWAKLHDKNTAFISGVRRKGCIEGVNVDIFPIDNAPNNKIVRKIRGFIIDKKNFIYQYRFQKHHKTSSCKMKIFQKAISFIPPLNEQKYKESYDRYIQKYNRLDTKNVVYLSNRKYSQKIIDKKCFEYIEMIKFEGKYRPAPIGWKKILTKVYGETYMQLPPKEERITVHGTKIVSIDKSWKEFEGEY